MYYYIFNHQPVLLGDRVRVGQNRMATVSTILEPLSDEAQNQEQPEGGVFINFDDGDCWLVQNFHEDFELVNRALVHDI
jgi:hypothetical protein